MKINRRRDILLEPSPWFIPLTFYFILKSAGVEFNQYEWLWWTFIPTMFVWWFNINWKINR